MHSLFHVIVFLLSTYTLSFPLSLSLPSELCPHLCPSSYFPMYNDCLTFVMFSHPFSPISLQLHCVLIVHSAPMFIAILNHPKLFVHVFLFSWNIPETNSTWCFVSAFLTSHIGGGMTVTLPLHPSHILSHCLPPILMYIIFFFPF